MPISYDRHTNMWLCFNDYRVTSETEEKVFEDSFGESKKKASAYSLVYVNSEIAQS